jgi:hypothetical protein
VTTIVGMVLIGTWPIKTWVVCLWPSLQQIDRSRQHAAARLHD